MRVCSYVFKMSSKEHTRYYPERVADMIPKAEVNTDILEVMTDLIVVLSCDAPNRRSKTAPHSGVQQLCGHIKGCVTTVGGGSAKSVVTRKPFCAFYCLNAKFDARSSCVYGFYSLIHRMAFENIYDFAIPDDKGVTFLHPVASM